MSVDVDHEPDPTYVPRSTELRYQVPGYPSLLDPLALIKLADRWHVQVVSDDEIPGRAIKFMHFEKGELVVVFA